VSYNVASKEKAIVQQDGGHVEDTSTRLQTLRRIRMRKCDTLQGDKCILGILSETSTNNVELRKMNLFLEDKWLLR
jgi:hypothetical protein